MTLTTQDRHERLYSTTYLDELHDARELIEVLRRDGWPLQRLVWRARAIYHRAWREEQRRARGRA